MPLHGPWIAEYIEYLENFDPTPDYLYDGYKTLLDYVGFWEEFYWELEA